MSRSYRKFPINKDCCRTSKDRFKPKTYANRAVRRYNDMPSGKSCFFKKIYCSWDICDYRILWVLNEKELKRQWNNKETFIYNYYRNYKEVLCEWKKCYINK